MASTVKLSRSVKLAEQFVRYAPQTFVNDGDPAFSNADWVRQFILGPPFAWRWNRNTVQFICTTGKQDYTQNLPDFGWIEKTTITQPNIEGGGGGVIFELETALDLAQESQTNQPNKVSAQQDDGNGNILFRLSPPPDQDYTVTVTYQKAAPIFSSLNATWAPIPDYLSFLYNQGLLAKTYEYLGDERFGLTMQLFLRQVIAANDGLDETEINIFLSDRLMSQRQTQSELGNSQNGRQGRGAF